MEIKDGALNLEELTRQEHVQVVRFLIAISKDQIRIATARVSQLEVRLEELVESRQLVMDFDPTVHRGPVYIKMTTSEAL
jgi:hypothetical protein